MDAKTKLEKLQTIANLTGELDIKGKSFAIVGQIMQVLTEMAQALAADVENEKRSITEEMD